MTKANNPTPSRSFRRWFKQVCSSFIKHLNHNCCDEIACLRKKCQDLEDLVDIIAREVSRLSKRVK
jgi:hypothetical protein